MAITQVYDNRGYNPRLERYGLLSSVNRVEAPFVMVKIGHYSFGVYNQNNSGDIYPNYVKSIEVKKINGMVNEYTVSFEYPITTECDVNFFEKLFSNVSSTRYIEFEYGDATQPEYIYRDEKCIITSVQSSYNEGSIIYTVGAVSSVQLSLGEAKDFAPVRGNPIDIIRDTFFGCDSLQRVYKGLNRNNFDAVVFSGISANNVVIPGSMNITPIDYIAKVVSYIVKTGAPSNSVKKPVFTLTTYDTTGDDGFDGPYFRVEQIADANQDVSSYCNYNIDIGFPSANLVTSISVKNDCNWAVLYNNSNLVSTAKDIDSNGNEISVYSPSILTSKQHMTEEDRDWWSKVTDYPIQLTMTIKGLLRPAILMNYISLNMYYFGKKSIVSGCYIITSHKDKVDESGFFSELTMVRIPGGQST